MAREFIDGTMKRLAARFDAISHGVKLPLSVQEMCAQQPQIPLVKGVFPNGVPNGHVNGITMAKSMAISCRRW